MDGEIRGSVAISKFKEFFVDFRLVGECPNFLEKSWEEIRRVCVLSGLLRWFMVVIGSCMSYDLEVERIFRRF